MVSSFFLGLALGSLVVGRRFRSRRWSPLLVYGLFEIGIGLFALAFPALFAWAGSAYGALHPWAAASAAGLFALRFALLFALFLAPTFLMGGTLPLLLDGLVERDERVGPLTSFLYGLNVLGAVGGVLLTSYLAIPELGMNGTSVAAGVGNLAIGALAVVAFRSAPRRPTDPADTRPSSGTFFPVLAFASGFAALGYQVAWARHLGLAQQPTVHLVALLLATFLVAIALGSLALGGVLRRGVRPLRVLALAQPLVPVTALFCLGAEWGRHGFERLEPLESLRVVPAWEVVGETFDAIFLGPLLQTASLLFVPALLLGVGLPSLIAAATRRGRELRANAGLLVFWNTVGSSVGSFAAGYVLLPTVGQRGLLAVLALVSIAIGLAAERRVALALVAAAVCALSLRGDVVAERIVEHRAPIRGARLVDVAEGPVTTAYVFESPGRTFLGSGYGTMAVAEESGVAYQQLMGHLPALFYPKAGAPERVLGIALGSGQSFGALLLHPIEQMDVVEISPEILGLSLERLARFHHGLGDDARVTFHLDDGRHFVDRAPAGSYDVVTMEPPPPTLEGVAALYSVEFYRSIRRVLRQDGVLAQWLPLGLVTPDDLRAIVSTQAEVFPWTFVARAGTADFVVLSFARSDPPVWSLDWIDERIEHLRRERNAAGHRPPGGEHRLDSRLGVLATLLTGPSDAADVNGTILHDDDQQLSYSTGDRELLRRYGGSATVWRLSFAALPLTPFRALQHHLVEPVPTAELDDERARVLARHRVALPSRVRAAEGRYHRAGTPASRARAAVAIAALHDRSLHKAAALAWVARAPVDAPVTAQQRDVARGIALHGIAVFGGTIRAWIDGLGDRQRESALVVAMDQVVREQEAWEAAHRRDPSRGWPSRGGSP